MPRRATGEIPNDGQQVAAAEGVGGTDTHTHGDDDYAIELEMLGKHCAAGECGQAGAEGGRRLCVLGVVQVSLLASWRGRRGSICDCVPA